jgi:transcriptional regulator with XRE-family HTH domain
MFEIGSSLKEARSRRKLSAADVHKAIRIRERYLTAIEEERWEMLPGDTYTKGFLRTYAEFLGLDGQLYVEEYNARIAQHEEEPLVPESLNGRGAAGGILFRTIGAFLVVGGVAGGLVALHHAGAPSRPTLEAAAAAAAPALAPAAAPVRRTVQKAPAVHAAKPVVRPKPTFTTIAAVRDKSWLSVRVGGPGGPEVFRGILRAGHTLRFGLAQAVWMRMGRPRALDIHVGKTLVHGLPHAPANLLLTKAGAKRR